MSELDALQNEWEKNPNAQNCFKLVQALSLTQKNKEIEELLDKAVSMQIEVPKEAYLHLPHWQKLGQLLHTWYEKPLSEKDGYSLAELTKIEKEREHPFWKEGLHRFPATMWQFFYMMGKRFEGSLLFSENEGYTGESWSDIHQQYEPVMMEFNSPQEVTSLTDEELQEYLNGDFDSLGSDAKDYLICAEGAWNGSVAFLQLILERKTGAEDPKTWLVSLEDASLLSETKPFSQAVTALVEMDLRCASREVLEKLYSKPFSGCLGKFAKGVKYIELSDINIFQSDQFEASLFDQEPLQQSLKKLNLEKEREDRVILQGDSLLVADKETEKIIKQKLN